MKATNKSNQWDEFRYTGLFLFVNQFLHIFGWAIVIETNSEGDIVSVYPTKTKWRGFPQEDVDEAYKKVSKLLKEDL